MFQLIRVMRISLILCLVEPTAKGIKIEAVQCRVGGAARPLAGVRQTDT